MNEESKNQETLIKEFLDKIEDILYQDSKFSDKDMALSILNILEQNYDI